MILLLGKNDIVEQYAYDVLKVDMMRDIVFWPDVRTHHTELTIYVSTAKVERPKVITTQNLELIDVLLHSDLDFDVITVRRYGEEIRARTLTKEEVLANREAFAFDPRD